MNEKFVKSFLSIALTLALCAGLVGCTTQDTNTATEPAASDAPVIETTNDKVVTVSDEETAAQYLNTYFGVTVDDKLTTSEGFYAALAQVTGKELPAVEDGFNALSVLISSMDAANYTELVLSYPQEKVKERLTTHGIKFEGESADAAYIACAADTGLFSKDLAAKAAAKESFTKEEITKILMNVVNANGDGRNYLAMSNDPAIYSKIENAWNSFQMLSDPTLEEIGKNAVLNQVTTGYNLKSDVYNARFLPELTLQYGHSDIGHAHQLIGLLNSEDIVVKVQLEPKVSIYEYLLEWGPVPEATPTYEVKQFGDRYLVYAVEYDMQLEFANLNDLQRFDSVIKKYAKKNEGNEAAVGLIVESWWQPLYTTTRTDMSKDDFHEIVDCVIHNGDYSIHPFCLTEDKDTIIPELEKLSGGLKVEPVTRFCNTAFHNYMTGDDYQ